MFAYLAAITERIGFATGILVLPQRQTALVARQAAVGLGLGSVDAHIDYLASVADVTRSAAAE